MVLFHVKSRPKRTLTCELVFMRSHMRPFLVIERKKKRAFQVPLQPKCMLPERTADTMCAQEGRTYEPNHV